MQVRSPLLRFLPWPLLPIPLRPSVSCCLARDAVPCRWPSLRSAARPRPEKRRITRPSTSTSGSSTSFSTRRPFHSPSKATSTTLFTTLFTAPSKSRPQLLPQSFHSPSRSPSRSPSPKAWHTVAICPSWPRPRYAAAAVLDVYGEEANRKAALTATSKALLRGTSMTPLPNGASGGRSSTMENVFAATSKGPFLIAALLLDRPLIAL